MNTNAQENATVDLAMAYKSGQASSCPTLATWIVALNLLVRACSEVDRQAIRNELLEVLG